MLSSSKPSFRLSALVNQLPSKPESNRRSNTKTEACYPAMPSMHLDRELPTVFSRHHTLDVFDDARQETPVIVELFGAIGDLDAILLTDKLVVSAFIDILKASPATNIVDQYMTEIRSTRANIIDQFDEAGPPLDPETAASLIDIGANNREVSLLCKCRDSSRLVLYRIALIVG